MKRIRIPNEPSLLLVSMAYLVVGEALAVYAYGEPSTAALPVCAVTLLAMTAAAAATGTKSRGRGWLYPWTRWSCRAVLVACSALIVFETGYMYAPDGIRNTLPFWPRWVYLGGFAALAAYCAALLGLYVRRRRRLDESDRVIVPAIWRR